MAGVEWTDTGWHARDAVASHNGIATRLWGSTEVDQVLWGRSVAEPVGGEGDADAVITPARLETSAYQLPGTLQEVAAAALRHTGRNWKRTLRLPIRFNGQCLGLGVEPTAQLLTDGHLAFVPTRYFDGECSNELWGFRIHRRDERQSIQPRDLAVDRAGRALSLDQSRAANIVGISLFAVTRDDKVMLIQQTQGNSVAPGALASSSSGSLDLADFPQGPRRPWWSSWWGASRGQGDGDVNGVRVLLTGMLRELHEECLVRPGRRTDGSPDYFAGEVRGETARVTGYWRWESRSMKPEFSGLVKVDVDAGTLTSRTHRGGETTFTERLVAVDADVLVRAADLKANTSTGWERRAINLLREGVVHTQSADTNAVEATTPEQVEAVEMSPSCEQAWVHAVRFVSQNPDWLSVSDELSPR
ncbi:hypothetical protein [Janibacter limosus]|uniref:Uncharacterized protein n=1 Tax=Janibacter limosus TaxID=53458 RepID=A0A4P6MY93_9MICO|nr:hypothetical protein [Janibacter limosus]QBF46710.1 hypothetical protein EXU32_10900 [Janibacter limosus]